MARPKGSKKETRPEIKAIINQVNENFTPEVIELGFNLIRDFTRADVTKVLSGDEDIVQAMAKHALRRRWITNLGTEKSPIPDIEPIKKAVEWMKVMRGISTAR